MKKIYIKTWGCQMNEYDSFIIKNILEKKINCKNTTEYKKADILILNTCSIREKSQEKLFHQLGRWKTLKKKNPKIIIAVGGCVANQEEKKIYKRAPYVDIIFGTQTIHKLPKMIYEKKKNKNVLINTQLKTVKKFNVNTFYKQKNLSAYITIMEGCNKKCTFCIVPNTRGKEISRSHKDIILEIKNMVKNNIKEITLLGQNVNSYFYKNKIYTYTFSKLLYKISEIDEIKRIRFITSHPKDFSNKIIDSYKKIPKLVDFLHLPIQSGSNKILKLMKRGYNVERYKKIIKKILKIRPNMKISSDFIIGFPGETKKDFEKTLKIISEINFDNSFSFIYSKRPNTIASTMLDNVTLQEKKERLYKIQKILLYKKNQWNRRTIGTIQNILVHKKHEKLSKKLIGTTENNRTVCFSGSENKIGKIVKVEITKMKKKYFEGKMVD
ncbi:tRNA (N6-isopentenyl adenosine(37)-C2)-methylthiotransferase MiaB [Buchnera aphidicola (Pseudoregma panicola)]|uniref:tRNA (N6-isopentenyl adenosine(37)-C2)-methylthiotransferase MiaB n=1 Tax=Buchnera aphidicola TaxID=9 RepID=UPI0031B6C2EF